MTEPYVLWRSPPPLRYASNPDAPVYRVVIKPVTVNSNSCHVEKLNIDAMRNESWSFVSDTEIRAMVLTEVVEHLATKPE